MKHISQKMINTLAAMTDWMTAVEITAVRGASRGPTVRAINKLHEKGLVEIATVTEGVIRHKYRRSEAGDKLISVYVSDPAKPKEPEVARTGSNPFEWRSFKQPVPWCAASH